MFIISYVLTAMCGVIRDLVHHWCELSKNLLNGNKYTLQYSIQCCIGLLLWFRIHFNQLWSLEEIIIYFNYLEIILISIWICGYLVPTKTKPSNNVISHTIYAVPSLTTRWGTSCIFKSHILYSQRIHYPYLRYEFNIKKYYSCIQFLFIEN